MKRLLFGCLFVLFISTGVFAYDTVPVTGEGFSYLFNIYKGGEDLGFEMEGKEVIGFFDILNNYRFPLFKAGEKWASVITGTNPDPVNYIIFSGDDFNAAAESPYTEVEELPYQVTSVNAKINNLTPIDDPDDDDEDEDLDAEGLIFLGLGVFPEHPGWASFSGFHSLGRSDLPDLEPVMLHEFMHSLGIASGVGKVGDTYAFSEPGKPLTVYDKDLRIYEGSTALPFDPTLEIVPQPEMEVGEDEDFDISTYSPYYVGENTIKVLGSDDDYDTAKDAIVANGGFTNYSVAYGRSSRPQVYGMPIHPTDGGKEGPDLSHLELRNSFMSHQYYRNWIGPMEAELAVLKDIGYDLDLRRHFGKSYYLNGVSDTFTSGFSQWDGSAYTGTPSDVIQAVGLHVYGDDNTIIQASDILTAGEGSFGVRIDGVGNDYTLTSGHIIQSNGKENIGLGVTWGSNHIVTVQSGSSVTANAADGIAASFDFGENLFGQYGMDKGSYAFYNDQFELNTIPDEEASAPLVKQFNVAGTLTGGQAAIYIANNAHVENINLLDGAQINGDIISQWNSVQSGPNATVQYFNGIAWRDVDPEDPSQIYFTHLNILGGDSVNVTGDINGSNEVYNTLQLHNAGTLNLGGETLDVNLLENTGILQVQSVDVATQSGEINGNGTILVAQELSLDSNINTVENTISLASGAVLSTLNNETQSGIEIDTLKSSNGKLGFDLGDTFAIQNPDSNNTASFAQIKVAEENLDLLTNPSYVLFDAGTEILDFGSASANVYYNGQKYAFTQNTLDPHLLNITATAGGELGDAVADATAANYIAVDGVLSKDAGMVQGNVFEISGADIDVNGHNGLVIDGANNPSGTLLRTGISGATDSNLTVQNGGELLVSAEERALTLGNTGETALSLSGAKVMLDSKDKMIDVAGRIQGTNKLTDTVEIKGTSASLNGVHHATMNLDTLQTVSMKALASDTVFNLQNGVLQPQQDAYLAASADNEITVNGGRINLSNGQASDITLSKMTLENDLAIAADVDLQTLMADRFVFANSADLVTNSHLLYLARIEVLHPQAILENESYEIPVVSSAYHNEHFLGGVLANFTPYTLQGPIFRYDVSFEQNNDYAGLRLARGSSMDYKSYNPAVLAGPIAAQVGGYLGQLAISEQSFERMNMQLMQERKDPLEGKLLSATENFHGTLADPKRVSLWANPYTSFGKVPLKRGPNVTNKLYGVAAGMDLPFEDIGRDWRVMGGFYVAYNGSRQRFEGITMEQNGAGFGVSGMAYKENLFAGVLVGGSVSDVRTKTAGDRDNSSIVTAGLSTEAGYIWELGARGQWQLQPELLAAYTWVYTPAYNNAANVRIHTDPLHAFTLQPQLRLTGDAQKWGQPYAEVAWVGNLGDKTKFKASNVSLPQFSVKPFMKYGLGIRESWAERWSGYLETYFTSGGVRSVAVQAGVSYAL